MFWKYDAGPDDIILWWHQYDAVSDLMHNWVAQTLDFKSALRVVRMVLNTQCYQYLWLAMWFHVKKSEETLKKSKSPILKCKFGFRAQKWSKIPPNNRSLNRGLLNFLWVWYISDGTWWILTSRQFRICMARGGRESARPSYGCPKMTLIWREKKTP